MTYAEKTTYTICISDEEMEKIRNDFYRFKCDPDFVTQTTIDFLSIGVEK
jgi:hypothetical protein